MGRLRLPVWARIEKTVWMICTAGGCTLENDSSYNDVPHAPEPTGVAHDHTVDVHEQLLSGVIHELAVDFHELGCLGIDVSRVSVQAPAKERNMWNSSSD